MKKMQLVPSMSLTEQLENLTDYYKENRDTFNDNFRLKMHRIFPLEILPDSH
jgi:genome